MRAQALIAAAVAACCAAAAAPAAAACGRAADGRDCDWRGEPTHVGGTATISRGELIASDFVHDDAGANVDGFRSPNPDYANLVTGIYPNPQDPASPRLGGTGNNFVDRFRHSGDFGYPMAFAYPGGYDDVADLLELRAALEGRTLHVLVRLGALPAPDSAVVGICLDTDRDARTGTSAFPRGANLDQQLGCEQTLTLWGTGGELTDAAGNAVALRVAANAKARPPFVEAEVPLSGRGGRPRLYVASGRWDAAAGAWASAGSANQKLAPGDLGRAPRIYDLLSRRDEPNSFWRDTAQADALAARDVSAHGVDLDLEALAARRDEPPPRLTGQLDVQYPARPLGDGQGATTNWSGGPGTFVYEGAVQPYSLMVPSDYHRARRPWPLLFFFHPSNVTHTIWPVGIEGAFTPRRNLVTDPPLGTKHAQEVVDRTGMLVAGTLQRGEKGPAGPDLPWGDVPGEGERDLRDVLATLRGRDRYAVDADRIVYSGMSYGGQTTQAMMTLYPDELAAAVAHNAPGTEVPPRLANVRNLLYLHVTGNTGLDATAPTTGRETAAAMTRLGHRHLYVEYLGRAHDFNLGAESLPILERTAYREVRDENPARVTYELDRAIEERSRPLGLAHDRAYWARDLRLADGAAGGSIDAIALPLARKLPRTLSRLTGTFVNTTTGNNAFVEWQEWDRDLRGLQDLDPAWRPSPDVAVTTRRVAPPAHAGENAFALTTRDLTAATLDLRRMGIRDGRLITGYLDLSRPLRLSLDLRGGAQPRRASVDGRTVRATTRDGIVAVDVPAGRHELVLDGWPELSVRSDRACASRRRFRIRLGIRKGVKLVAARVSVNGRPVRVLRGRRLRAPVDLRGLPRGTFTVRIEGRTRDGRRYVAHRRYRTCTPKR